MRTPLLVAALAAVAAALIGAVRYSVGSSRALGTTAQRATYDVLHMANQAAPPLRGGLTADSAAKAAPSLRRLLGTPAIALADASGLLAWEGVAGHHGADLSAPIASVLRTGRSRVLASRDLGCSAGLDCPLRAGVLVPLTVSGSVVGVLAALGPTAPAGLLRTSGEVASFASTQLELSELDMSRTRAAQAELRYLRAQISPHFIYNALTAIASFVRSDPGRARELLLQFAAFTRYSFRSHGQYATLAEELRSVDTYLALERARFGERLRVTLRVAPEVLPVAVPCLVLQPLVENAIRHGLEHKAGPGHLEIVADDVGSDCVITVEDDGSGMDPDRLREQFRARSAGSGVGLANVDERLRTVFGPAHGLVVETNRGAGTKVTLRVPKYRAGVRAS